MKMIKLLLAIILLLTVVGFLDALNMNKSKFNLRLERESEPIKCLADKKCANADLVCNKDDNCVAKVAKASRESESADGDKTANPPNSLIKIFTKGKMTENKNLTLLAQGPDN